MDEEIKSGVGRSSPLEADDEEGDDEERDTQSAGEDDDEEEALPEDGDEEDDDDVGNLDCHAIPGATSSPVPDRHTPTRSARSTPVPMDESAFMSSDFMSSGGGKPLSLRRGPGRPRTKRWPSRKGIGLKLKRWKRGGSRGGRGGNPRKKATGSASPMGESPPLRSSDDIGMSLVDELGDPLPGQSSTSDMDKSFAPPEDVPVYQEQWCVSNAFEHPF